MNVYYYIILLDECRYQYLAYKGNAYIQHMQWDTMAIRGSPRYYEELLDAIFRGFLACYICIVIAFWLTWIFSHHAYSGGWYVLLFCGALLVGGYFLVYFTDISLRLSERHGRDKAR
jgi:hypothetical protein